MVVGLRDGLKRIGISVVCLCAVFVCTFMLNYYLDVLPLGDTVTESGAQALYRAQLATARMTAAVSGGFLALIAVVMVVFYIQLYVDEHARQLGVLKAMGYSNGRIALGFWVFGASVLAGCALGFGGGWAIIPYIYREMTIEGMAKIPISFHPGLSLSLVVAPTAFFTMFSCAYAAIVLRSPVSDLLRGKSERDTRKIGVQLASRSFLREMRVTVLKSRKLLVFFVSFACFCFGAMVQMGISMKELSSVTMGALILGIGVVLSVVILYMSVTSMVRANLKNIALMKAFGYSLRECVSAVLGGYVPFAFLGFAAGTLYQFGLLFGMVNFIFADVGEVPEYRFNVSAFFVTLAVFIVCYGAAMIYYVRKIANVSVKEVMQENR